MKSAIVTGATGFIGSHLTRRLVMDGWQVHVLKRPSSSLRRIQDVADRLNILDVMGDGADSIWDVGGRVDAIFHLATAYGRGGEPASSTLETNLVFPLRLLEGAIARAVPLFVATDTCFTPAYSYLRPYTLSKKQFAAWANVLGETCETRIVNLVLQHPYGPHDSAEKFVPWIIERCLNPCGTIDLTSGVQEKDFIYVEDVVRAYLSVAARMSDMPRGFTELQCGTGSAISVRQFVESVHRLTGSKAELNFGALPDRAGEVMRSVAETRGLRRLGWTASVALDEGLRQTIAAHHLGTATKQTTGGEA